MAAGLLAIGSTAVQAQGFVDVTMGAASGGLATYTAVTYDGLLGYFGARFGVEGDFGYSKNVGPSTTSPPGLDVTFLNARTVSADLLVGPKVGPNGQWRPYGAVGFGVLGAIARNSDIYQVTTTDHQNDFALNFGGGVLGFVTDRLGLRVDIRYFKDLYVAHVLPEQKSYFIRFGAGVALKF
jgi:opacity protein-like surface antigen